MFIYSHLELGMLYQFVTVKQGYTDPALFFLTDNWWNVQDSSLLYLDLETLLFTPAFLLLIVFTGKKPLPPNTNTRPRFRYVQAHPRKRVLVLDTSGSMTVSRSRDEDSSRAHSESSVYTDYLCFLQHSGSYNCFRIIRVDCTFQKFSISVQKKWPMNVKDSLKKNL